MLQFYPYVQKCVTIYMHHTESARKQRDSQIIPDLGVLIARIVHGALLAPRIYRWLLDFWKISGLFF